MSSVRGSREKQFSALLLQVHFSPISPLAALPAQAV